MSDDERRGDRDGERRGDRDDERRGDRNGGDRGGERSESRREEGVSVLVRNLTFKLSKEDLREEFEKFGSVKDVYIPLDYMTREPRGFSLAQIACLVDSMAEMTAKSVPFSPPVVHHNKDSWGPTSENLPQQFVDVPYAPFGKGDRLGRAADFTMSSYYSAKQKYRRDRENRAGDDFKNEEFQYKYDAVEDSSFHLRVDRGSSVKVAADWKCVEEFDLAQLTKLSTKVAEATDLLWAGELGTHNDAYDRLSTRADKPLQRCENREFYYVTTTDDPAIEKLAEEQAGTEDDKDKKPADEINTPEKLSIEATMINQNFSQQILKTDPAPEKMALPNPFAASRLHGLVEKRGEKHKMTAYCLNEWDSKLSGGVEWRQKIDSQRGAVLATELKNNSCKLARWTAQSILAGAEQMKLGYVSRASRARTPTTTSSSSATQFYKPREFATQITLNVNNMWGIIKMLPIVRISPSPTTFDDESDEDDVELQNENDSDESD
ncbi:translation initiation factor [Aureococcus anophagefferens]|uniref:Translation initiation factor n=1 Tax=Aureococcus anophagefferens TaxID=44056 RepID=A0ABR1FGG7_AURAN